YAERIDPALKRRGRIDDHFLLLPPDTTRRKALLQEVVRKEVGEAIDEDKASDIAMRTPLWTYNEYDALVATASRRFSKDPSPSEVASELDKEVRAGSVTPTIRLASYHSRLVSKDEGDKPFEEFLLLVHLVLETRQPEEGLSPEEMKLVRLVSEE